MHRSDRIRIFCTELWSWFEKNKRTLPWRDITEKNLDHKAYLILVSEVMLQQTQVSRVIILYKNFIQQFPYIEALSKASNREILIAWRGLGYNNRAIRLRDAAKTIVDKYHGKFPREMTELQELPGVGHYTAGAIRNFAFGIPTPCMDVNIRRILHRFFVGPENADGTWKKNDAYLLELSQEILTEALRTGSTQNWHAALMDFGSLICTKNNPQWQMMSKKMESVCMAYGKRMVRTPVPDCSKQSVRGAAKKVNKEPGRMMAGKFIPNRIFRGRIIETLRDARNQLTLEELGSQAIGDWTLEDNREWLEALLKKLQSDGLIEKKRGKYLLHG